MKKAISVLVLALLSIAMLVGCNPINPTPNNHNPVINASTPDQSTYTIAPGGVVNFSVTANDEDGDNLTYTWTASKGTPTTGNASTFSWTAPQNEPDTVNVAVVVQDGNNGNVTKSWTITVEDQTTSSIIEVKNDIKTPTTWETGKIYFINTYEVKVLNTTLTIQPGAIIKFKTGSGLSANQGGVIKAQGTEANPIIFTSIRDDAHGGDTNADGPSVGEPGDWNYIVLRDINGHIFDYCQFFYGGSTGSDLLMNISGVSATITNCTFANNASDQHGALWAADATAGTKIQNNIFYGNGKPLYITTTYSIDDTNVFHDPTNPAITNKQNGIFVDTNDVEAAISWNETEVPFVVNYFSVKSSASLTLTNDVVVKFLANGKISASGPINATDVIFTSIKDDVKGNTNSDLTVVPNAADWDGIQLFNNTVGSFKQCQFKYGKQALFVASGTITVDACTFAYNDGANGAALSAHGAAHSSKIINNVFYGNIKPLQIEENLSLDDSNNFSYNNISNEYNSVLLWGGDIVYPVTWSETEVAFICDYLDITNDASLVLSDNVVIKMRVNGKINYRNNLTMGENCYITAYPDDTLKGDSNNDKGATSPYANFWKGVYNSINFIWVVSDKYLWSENSSL